jgi:PAS domain S-box-containing protein
VLPKDRSDSCPPQFLDALVEGATEGLMLLAASGAILTANQAAAQLLSRSREDLVGHSVYDVVFRQRSEPDFVSSVITKRATVTRGQVLPDGRQLIVSARPVVLAGGDEPHVVLSLRDASDIKDLVSRVQEAGRPRRRWAEMRTPAAGSSLETIVADSPAMRAVWDEAVQCAAVDSPVLVLGETGTGKGVFARLIHDASVRRSGPFREVNCGALPEGLIESELFGYAKGAFTGADWRGKAGLIELAEGGTLLLDEIGDLPLGLQVKLLRFLETGEVWPVGAARGKRPDARIVAATNCDLRQMIEDRTFRKDLFYRLDVLVIRIPPLRDHLEDVPALVDMMLRQLEDRLGSRKTVTPAAIDALTRYQFPGNVRELWNIVERLVVTVPRALIDESNLPPEVTDAVAPSAPVRLPSDEPRSLKETLQSIEAQLLRDALERYGTQALAAKHLGVTQPTIARKTRQYGLAD